jgi:predicted RNase H-related nuclease YkuK (DUF458 family)
MKELEGFRKFNGEPIVNVIEYLQEQINASPNLKIAVGCDSKQRKFHTTYATAIVLWDSELKKGAHIIFKRERVKKIKDIFQRLYNEVERSHKLAEVLDFNLKGITPEDETEFKKKITIHCDFNPNARWKSNMIYATAKSWLEGCGFVTKFKPEAYASSSCADILCQ